MRIQELLSLVKHVLVQLDVQLVMEMQALVFLVPPVYTYKELIVFQIQDV